MEATAKMTRESKMEIAQLFKALPPMARHAFAIGVEAGKLQARAEESDKECEE